MKRVFMPLIFAIVCLTFSPSGHAEPGKFLDSAFLTRDSADNLCIYFHNPSDKTLSVREVYLNGRNLDEMAKESRKLKFQVERKKGIIKWFDIVPNPVEPGGWAVLKIRFGDIWEVPDKEKIEITIVSEEGIARKDEIEVSSHTPAEFSYSVMDNRLEKLHLYLSAEKNLEIRDVLINGEECNPEIMKIQGKEQDWFIVTASFPRPLEEGTYSIIKLNTDKGPAAASVRAMKPFFPVGIVDMTANEAELGDNKTTPAKWGKDVKLASAPAPLEWFKDCSEHLINTVYYGGLPGGLLNREGYEKFGIKLLDDAWWQSTLVKKYRYDPVLLCWSVADEPAANNVNPMDLLRQTNERYRKYDSVNPVSHVYCIWPGFPAQEYNFVDVVMQDVYPIPSGHPAAVAESMQECWRAARPKPVWFAAQSFGWLRDNKPRYPTPDELRLMVYEALSCHAKGIYYFAYGFWPGEPWYGVGIPMEKEPQAKVLWESMRWLNRELSLLGDFILKGDPVPLAKSSRPELNVSSIVSENSIVLICINDNYKYDEKGTIFNAVKNARVEVSLPGWFDMKDLIKVSPSGIEKTSCKKTKNKILFTIPETKVTSTYILTSSESLYVTLKEKNLGLLETVPKLKQQVNIDGRLSDWKGMEPVVINPDYAHYFQDKSFRESEDLSVRVYTGWTDDNFYIAARVRDDIHQQRFEGGDIWAEDLLQIGFDPENSGMKENLLEYGFALTSKGPQAYCWNHPDPHKKGQREDIKFEIRRKEPYTVYEAYIPLEELGIKPDRVFGFNFIVVDADKEPYYEIADFLQLSPGIVGGKMPAYFKKFILKGYAE